MAVLIVTTPFGLSLLAAWILFKVVIYDVPRGPQRMTVKHRTTGLWRGDMIVSGACASGDRRVS